MIQSPRTALALAFLCTVGLISACRPVPPIPPTTTAQNYPDSISVIMSRSCLTGNCHKGGTYGTDLNLTTWEKAMSGSSLGSVIIPYNADWSHVFQHVNTFEELGLRAAPTMPSADSALSRQDVLAIRNWILAGAKSAAGKEYWAARTTVSNGKIFALCSGSDVVAVIDIATNKIMRYIAVGQTGALESPHYIRLSPDGKSFYVSLILGGLVEKYRTDTYEFQGRVSLGNTSQTSIIRLNRAGTRAAVSLWTDGSTPKLALLNTENMTLLDQVSGSDLIDKAHGLVANRDFTKLLVTANAGNYVASVSIANDKFGTIDQFALDGTSIPQASVAFEPYWITYSPDSSQYFVACSKKNDVRVFNTATHALVATIPVGSYPRQMVVDAATNRLFVACRDQQNQAAQGTLLGCVSVIDLASLAVSQTIYNLGHRPHGLAIDNLTRRLYVSIENTGGATPPHHAIAGSTYAPGFLNVIDLATLGVLDTRSIQLAAFPTSVGVVE